MKATDITQAGIRAARRYLDRDEENPVALLGYVRHELWRVGRRTFWGDQEEIDAWDTAMAYIEDQYGYSR
jgi:hypothetical protein